MPFQPGKSGNPKGPAKGTKKKATIEKEVAREILRDMVKAALPAMTQAQIAHAQGLSYLVYRDKKAGKFVTVTQENIEEAQQESTIEVWSKDPSVQAFTDLLNRTLDKPTEHLEAVVSVSGLGERIARARERVKRS